ncbi:MAG: sulfurtransferase complex subunit TusD [Gammaproteobacteria bacterium]|nr:sulfurtransferase complex subunit TusD [Gammaproteobacteria bacterium]
MKISLLVQGAPYSTDACIHSLRFAQATLAQNHQIQTVFFYKDAVSIINPSFKVPKDELNIQDEWKQFALEHRVELNVCVGASHRRGVNQDSDGIQDVEPFVVIGLGVFIEQMSLSDRIVVFL